MTPSKGYHTDITGQTQEIVKTNGLQLLISTVFLITEVKPAQDIVQEGPDNKQPLVDIIFEDIPSGGILLGHRKGLGALKRRAQIAGRDTSVAVLVWLLLLQEAAMQASRARYICFAISVADMVAQGNLGPECGRECHCNTIFSTSYY